MFLTYGKFLAYGESTDVTLAEFTRTERKAEAFIDGIAHRRVKDEDPVRERYKKTRSGREENGDFTPFSPPGAADLQPQPSVSVFTQSSSVSAEIAPI